MMYCLKNGLIRFAGIMLMVLIGILQTVGIMITGSTHLFGVGSFST